MMISVDTWQEILDFESQLARGGKIQQIIPHLLSIQCVVRQVWKEKGLFLVQNRTYVCDSKPIDGFVDNLLVIL